MSFSYKLASVQTLTLSPSSTVRELEFYAEIVVNRRLYGRGDRFAVDTSELNPLARQAWRLAFAAAWRYARRGVGHERSAMGVRRFNLRRVGTVRLLGDHTPLLCLDFLGGGGGTLTAFLAPQGGYTPYDATAFQLFDFDLPSSPEEADWLSGSITRGFHGSIHGRELIIFPLTQDKAAHDRQLCRRGTMGTLGRRHLPVLEIVR